MEQVHVMAVEQQKYGVGNSLLISMDKLISEQAASWRGNELAAATLGTRTRTVT